MKLQEVMALIQVRCPNVSVSDNEDAIINFINLGVAELYRRFNLKIKSETIVTTNDLALYTLRNDDVELVLYVYDKTGRELRQSDVINSMDYDYKILNYRSILLRHPHEGYIYVVYKASPIKLRDMDDEIDLPSTMLDALLTYVSYVLVGTINSDQKNESSMFYQMFTRQCDEMVNQGYKISLNSETVAIQAKGFA